jgi:glycosyltransferase involved in cell wall biosynthesis
VVFHLAREFSRLGHKVEIITNRYPRSLANEEEIDGVQVTRLHFLLPDLKYIRNLRFDLWLAGLWYQFYTSRVLRNKINEFRPDIINNHYLNETAEFTQHALAAQSFVVPCVISLHGGDVDGEPLLSEANKSRFGRLSGWANELTACSVFLADKAQALEPDLKGKIHVIHNGVDVKGFANAMHYQSDDLYILAVGQLVPHKGFDLLIKAFARVAEKYPKVKLWLAGDGFQRGALQAAIHQMNLMERVQLLGRMNEVMIASLMAGCLFLAVPSLREPFGIVALEGMAAGKPTLASNVGGLPELLPVPPNRLVAPNLEAWVAALDEWLALAMYGQLQANKNIEEAGKHDWSTVADQYLQIYQQALGQ